MYQRLISQFVMDEADILLNDPFKNSVLESLQILRKINKDLKVVAAGATLPRNGTKQLVWRITNRSSNCWRST